MSLYVYCVAGELPELQVPGVQNQFASVLGADPFRAVVSEFSGSELKPTKENLFAHERVVEAVMAIQTPLPFRFGTVVSEEKLRMFLQTNTENLQNDLEMV